MRPTCQALAVVSLDLSAEMVNHNKAKENVVLVIGMSSHAVTYCIEQVETRVDPS